MPSIEPLNLRTSLSFAAVAFTTRAGLPFSFWISSMVVGFASAFSSFLRSQPTRRSEMAERVMTVFVILFIFCFLLIFSGGLQEGVVCLVPFDDGIHVVELCGAQAVFCRQEVQLRFAPELVGVVREVVILLSQVDLALCNFNLAVRVFERVRAGFNLHAEPAFGSFLLDLRAAEARFCLRDALAGLHAVEEVHRDVQCHVLVELIPLGGIPVEEVVLVVCVLDAAKEHDCRLVAAFLDFDVQVLHVLGFFEHHEFPAALFHVRHAGVGVGVACRGVAQVALELHVAFPFEAHGVQEGVTGEDALLFGACNLGIQLVHRELHADEVKFRGEPALEGLFHEVQVFLEHVLGGVHDADCGIEIDELVKCIRDIVADLGLLVFEIHFAYALVCLCNLDTGTHLALGVENLRGRDAYAGLPAVALRLHAVNEPVHGGADNLLVVGVCHGVAVLVGTCCHLGGGIGKVGAFFDIVQAENTGNSCTQVDCGVGVAVAGGYLGAGAFQVFFGRLDVRRFFKSNIDRFFAGVRLARPRWYREAQGKCR